MAVDESLKEDIKIYYETHSLSVAKVYDVFSECDVSKKTIEAWVTNERWTKNKYPNAKAKAKETLTASVVKNIKDDAKDELLKALEEDAQNQTPEYNEKVVAELINDELSLTGIQVKMAKNLKRAEVFAEHSKSITTNKTFHDMLVSTHQVMHGKQPTFVINNLNGNISGEEMKNMSKDELKKIIEKR